MAKMSNEQAWDYALGIIKVDGLEPSDDFLKLVEQEKQGKITDADIIKALDRKYKMVGEADEALPLPIPGNGRFD